MKSRSSTEQRDLYLLQCPCHMIKIWLLGILLTLRTTRALELLHPLFLLHSITRRPRADLHRLLALLPLLITHAKPKGGRRVGGIGGSGLGKTKSGMAWIRVGHWLTFCGMCLMTGKCWDCHH